MAKEKDVGPDSLRGVCFRRWLLGPEKSAKTLMSLRPIFRRINFGSSGE